VESYADLAKRLTHAGVRVVLVGAQSDAWTREYFTDVPHEDMIGKTDLIDLLAIFRAASVVVTHDTASLHLPQLVGTPVVGIFGPTNPAERIPHDFSGSVLWGGESLPCRPCYDGRVYGVCRSNICLKELGIKQVLESVVLWLQKPQLAQISCKVTERTPLMKKEDST
jgi:heptosyltransferase-2